MIFNEDNDYDSKNKDNDNNDNYINNNKDNNIKWKVLTLIMMIMMIRW